jgi:hypothetical protein
MNSNSYIGWLPINTLFAATLAAAVGLGGYAAPARGATVFSNLGAGDSFSLSTAWSVSGPDAGGQDVAAPFTVGATAFTLNSAELALGLFDGTNSLNVSLVNDASGSPGSNVLASTTVSGIPSFSVSSPGLVTADLSGASFVLEANTGYWLVAVADGDTAAGWSWNTTGGTGVVTRTNGGSWDAPSGTTAPAFRIHGTAVPEPATLALLGFGGLAMPRCRRGGA